MRTIILMLALACAASAQKDASLFKLGDFEYSGEKIAVVPYKCSDFELCDIIRDEFEDLMFEYFDTNYIVQKKVKKALRKARLKELDEENRAAIANHLKADILLYLNIDIKAEESAEISALIKAEMIFVDSRNGKELLKIQSISSEEHLRDPAYKQEVERSGYESLLQKRFKDMFVRGFD